MLLPTKMPTKRISFTTIVIGIIICFFMFFGIVFSIGTLFYNPDNSALFPTALLGFVLGLILINIGNKKIIDEEELVPFLRKMMENRDE